MQKNHHFLAFFAGFVLATVLSGGIAYYLASEYQASSDKRIGQLGIQLDRATEIERRAKDILGSSRGNIKVLRELIDLYFEGK